MIIQTHSTHRKKILPEANAVVFQPQQTSWRSLIYQDYKLVRQEINPDFLFTACKKVHLIQFDMLEEVDLIYLLWLKHKNKLQLITHDSYLQSFLDYNNTYHVAPRNILIQKIFEGDEAKGIKFIANKKETANLCNEVLDLFQAVICICEKLQIPTVKVYTNFKLFMPRYTEMNLLVKNLDNIKDSIYKTSIIKL